MLVDTSGFIGPTLAAAGLSFLIPLTRTKRIDLPVPNFPDALVTSKKDQELVGLIWLLFLASLFAWSASCYTSIRAPDDSVFGWPVHFVIGLGTYLLSLIMTFVKGKI